MSQPDAIARPLRVLMIEDSADDAELMLRELRRAGFKVQSRRVETAEAASEALDAESWDVFISDYALPKFSGLDALRLVQERKLDVPFIIVSGAISDEAAVSAMKSGAHDYVLKQNLARLAPAISRELREARLRQERQRVQEELEALREQSAAELRRSLDQLHVVLSGVAEGIVAEDASGIVYANDAAARSLGYAGADEMIRAGRPDVQHRLQARNESGQQLAASDFPGSRALSERCVIESLLCWRDARGDDRWYIVTSTPYRDEQRNVWTAITIFRDITERRHAAATAQFLADASQELAASIDFDSTLAAMARLAVPRFCDWCVVELADPASPDRPALAAAHARSGEQESVLRFVSSFPELWRMLAPRASRTTVHDEATLEWVRQAPGVPVEMLGPRAALAVPLREPNAHGSIVFVRVRADWRYSPEDVKLGEEIVRRGSLALENALLYRQAREAIEARDEFLSIASHELRTPLTTLTLQLQRLQQLVRSAGTSGRSGVESDRLEQAVKQAHRLAGLIDTLLDVSRVSAGRLQVQREELDLAELLTQLGERLSEDARRAGCRLSVTLQAPLWGVWDRQRIEQVITNLLANSFKYGAGHPVELTARGTADVVEVSVRDEGIGISPQDLRRVFQRFARAVSSRHYGGLGLGLFIVQQIVDAHGGATKVESTPGKGSTFTVVLPRRGRRGGAQVSPEPAASHGPAPTS